MKVEAFAAKKPDSLRGIGPCKLLVFRKRTNQKKAIPNGFIHASCTVFSDTKNPCFLQQKQGLNELSGQYWIRTSDLYNVNVAL